MKGSVVRRSEVSNLKKKMLENRLLEKNVGMNVIIKSSMDLQSSMKRL